MKQPQLQTVNQKVLANLPVEELERRLELEMFRPAAALCCSWDATCSDCCDCTCYGAWVYSPCTDCSLEVPCWGYVPCTDCSLYFCDVNASPPA